MSDFESREDVTARVKEQADIVQIIGECVGLKKSGARYLGLCPFHGEKTPSFSVHPVKQFFYCFGCGESGDVFSFMMKYHNLDFPGALKDLARRYQIQLPEKPLSPQEKRRISMRKQMIALNMKIAEIYRDYLLGSSEAAPARNYLKNRQISLETQEKFQVGYAPSVESGGWNFLKNHLNDEQILIAESLGLLVTKDRGGYYDRFRGRIMFPIVDPVGKVIGFGGRIVGEGQPKYMNSPESIVFNKSKSLFGFFQAQESIRKEKRVVLVEGNFDLVSLVDGGCENVVAPLGTSLTKGQLALIKRSCGQAVLLFDGDSAGRKAAVRAAPLFLSEELSGKVALLPKGHDPDSFIRDKGIEELNKLIDQASPLPEFVFDQLVEKYGLTLDGKRLIVKELQPLMEASGSDLQRSVIVSHFAEKLGLLPEELKRLLMRESKMMSTPAPDPDREERLRPLASAQSRLVRSMVLNPSSFNEFEQAGSRECLEGTIGEVLFLLMKKMLKDGADLQPEELLTELPEGVERSFVAELLVSAAGEADLINHSSLSDENSGGMSDLLEWIKCETLKRRSTRLTVKIKEIQEGGDFDHLQKLMAEKVKIDNELQDLLS